MEKDRIYQLIHSVGATPKYKGYHYLADAIELELSMGMEEDTHIRITKDIYPALAKKRDTKPTNIEHNIRRIVNICCKEENRPKLEKIAGRPILYPPTNREFIEIFTFYLWTNRDKKNEN